MRRREFITLLGGAAAAMGPLAARAQPAPMPVVGFLRATPAAPFTNLLAAFRFGLGETGYVEGRNVELQPRWADNQMDRLPALAADLVRRRAAVIVCDGAATEAARAASATTPIVFVVADDPVAGGLVASLSRPGGNLTGLTFFGAGQLGTKRVELLRDLVPGGRVIAVLLDPNHRGFGGELAEAEAAGRALGRRIVAVRAAGAGEFAAAFETFAAARADAVLIGGGPVFDSQRRALVDLAARHRIPAIYDQRDFVADGGLISYAASLTGAYRQAGVYAGRILKGAKPSELPVLQPTMFELAINLKTAKALGLDVPPALVARADEVIE